jgi:hypothetical protein
MNKKCKIIRHLFVLKTPKHYSRHMYLIDMNRERDNGGIFFAMNFDQHFML